MGPDMLRGIDLWNIWSKVECPVLVLHGAQSEVLLPATLAEMRSRKPDVQIVEFEGVGHAPALMNAEQIDVVKQFLLQ
jgi:pimeloyl-ACP methyl ester carboxylesterase